MIDQAHKLRNLIHTEGPSAQAAPSGPPMIVVTGGRQGVGATTVAVNLAAVLADRIQRVLLVDAAEERSNMADIAGVRSACDHSLADVLGGKCAIADAITPGPAGTMLLANHRRRKPSLDSSRHALRRLMSALQSLRGDVDLLIIDTGSSRIPSTRRFWQRAELVILVTTIDDAALMDAYAAIKRNSVSSSETNDGIIRLLVNQCENDRLAADAHRRLTSCCHRFLTRSVPALPPLPRYVMREDASEGSCSRVWERPNSPYGHAALWLGRAVSDLLCTAASPSAERKQENRHHHAELAPC